MRQFNYFQGLYKSFYSKAFYQDVGQNWGGGVLLYLLLVLIISLSVTVYSLQSSLLKQVSSEGAQVFIKQFPNPMTFENGVLKTPENRPYPIVDEKSQQIIGVIDTSGQYTRLNVGPLSEGPVFLMTTNEIFMKGSSGEVKEMKIPEFTLVIDPMNIKEFFMKWLPWAWVILFPLMIFFMFCYRVIQAMFYAIVGKLISFVVRFRLDYFLIMRLMIVALTPVIFFGLVTEYWLPAYHISGWWYFGLAIAYLTFAMWANKRSL